MNKRLFFCLSAMLATQSLWAAPLKSQKPNPAASGVTGLARHPLSEARQAKRKAVVLFFIMTDCPIANRFAPEISRISQDYEKRNVAFYVVHIERELKAARAREHAQEYGFSIPVLLDRRRELVKFCGASVTPESVILSPEGKVLYRGRIDDRYAALGHARAQPTKRDLRQALNEILKNKTVSTPRTKAIGCYIEG